jgi:hypothetical protein
MTDILLIEVPPQGPRGPQGPKGDQGGIGPQGLIGDQGPRGDTGPAAYGFFYNWLVTTDVADHGAGTLAADNATFASITQLIISKLDAQNNDLSNEIVNWANNTSTVKGTLKIAAQTTPPSVMTFDVTSITNNSGDLWCILHVTPVTTPAAPFTASPVLVGFAPTGDKGDPGSLSGAGSMAFQNADAVAITGGSITGMPTPANASDVATKGYADGADATRLRFDAAQTLTAPQKTQGAANLGAALLSAANAWLAVQGYAEIGLTYSSGGTTAWDVSLAPVATLAASGGNTTMGAPSNVLAGRFYTVRIVQDTTPRSIAWNAAYKFIGLQAPTLSPASGAVDHFIFYGRAANVLEEVGRSQAVG